MSDRVTARALDSSWEFEYEGTWLTAEVPGHIHVDLLRHNLMEDPFREENEKACQWVDERDWSYRCIFDWTPDGVRPHRFLRFDGLDTVCEIFLNGERIGEHDNMFVAMEIDVSDRLRSGSNEIRVDIQSAARVGQERKKLYLEENGLVEDTPNFDERAFVRKAQYMFGWDWGPRLVSCGIWKPVSLIESDRCDRNDSSDTFDRKVVFIQNSDQNGATFEFYVDGKPFYALGANWIPDHSFPSEVFRERYRERLRQAKDLGINMLRIWGGGIYEDDAFYEICDELGILVWQDFMFACSYYPDDEEWQREIRREAEYQVKRLRHHPCIAIWCGNNECHQVWQDGWGGKDKQPPRFHGEVLYHQILRDVVERLDPGRPYWPGSPYGNGYCNSGQDGDQHYWDVWHGRGDWTFYKESDARFCSEFGFASSPSRATWKRAGVETTVEKENASARAHNKTGKPFELFTGMVELHYPKAGTLDEWSYYSQLNQRDAMRAAIEHFRLSNRCRGALLWQLNDCWPVESWSVLEFDGRKKAVAYELPRLFAPLLLSIDCGEGGATLRGCLHNSDSPVTGSATLTAIDMTTGQVVQRREADVAIDPEQVVQLVTSDANTANLLWVGHFGGAKVCAFDAVPSGIRRPEPHIEMNGTAIRISSETPLVDVRLEDLDSPANTFEPNFFNVLPGEQTAVECKFPPRKLDIQCLNFGQ